MRRASSPSYQRQQMLLEDCYLLLFRGRGERGGRDGRYDRRGCGE